MESEIHSLGQTRPCGDKRQRKSGEGFSEDGVFGLFSIDKSI
jgi:hypothetical protein